MNHETRIPQSHLELRLAPRQQMFEFSQSDLWRQLPTEDQQACLQALAMLLAQVIAEPLFENKLMQDNEKGE